MIALQAIPSCVCGGEALDTKDTKGEGRPDNLLPERRCDGLGHLAMRPTHRYVIITGAKA